jgi:Acidobacterial duplicated orphan permease
MRDDGRRRYASLPRSSQRIRSEIDEEIGFDIEMRARELAASGMTLEAAREQAAHEFGDIDATRRYCESLDADSERAGRWSQRIAELHDDLRAAWRGMRQAPVFALVVIVTLGLGIGANTAVFSVVRRMLIDRLPYRDAGQLLRVYGGASVEGASGLVTPKELADLAKSPSLSGVAAFGWLGGGTYQGEAAAEIWRMAAVTPNFFDLLGSKPRIGRSFQPADTASDAPPVLMISDEIWQRVFGGDPRVIGRVIQFSGGPRTVVGVMPREFVSPNFVAEIWIPLAIRPMPIDPARPDRDRAYRGLARLRDGATLRGARADVMTIAARWREENPGVHQQYPLRIVPLRDAMVGDVRPALLSVMGAALVVLIITCINVAGLFLARATARRRELAVRSALGAGRGRLIRQLLTESATYGLTGGALGVALAFAVSKPLARIASETLPHLGEIRLDVKMLIMAVIASIVSGLAFGVFPAFAATRVDLKQSLGDSGRGTSASGSRVRARQVLVTAQIALAVVLMVAAGLLVRSFSTLVRVDLGYRAGDDVITFSMLSPPSTRKDPASRNAFYADVLTRIEALPGVQSAGLTSIGPWNGPYSVRPKLAPTLASDPDVQPVLYMTATERYFAAVGTRIIRGRSIRPDDRLGAPPVVLLSESLAHRLFRKGDAIGARVLFEGPGRQATTDQWRTVIGIVADIRERATRDQSPAVYVSDWQEGLSYGPMVVVRTKRDAASVLPALKQLVHDVSPQSPFIYPRTLHDVLHDQIAPQELSMDLFAAFAALALALAALGVYAVMAYAVAARTREIGIRTALGAARGSVMLLVVRQGIFVAALGAAAGLLLAAAGARLLQPLLAGVPAHDAVTFIAAPTLLIAVTLAACVIPARTAMSVDPTEALKSD